MHNLYRSASNSANSNLLTCLESTFLCPSAPVMLPPLFPITGPAPSCLWIYLPCTLIVAMLLPRALQWLSQNSRIQIKLLSWHPYAFSRAPCPSTLCITHHCPHESHPWKLVYLLLPVLGLCSPSSFYLDQSLSRSKPSSGYPLILILWTTDEGPCLQLLLVSKTDRCCFYVLSLYLFWPHSKSPFLN